MFGLKIEDARTIVVKSRGHFRAGFDPWFPSGQVIEVDAPGLTSPVFDNFDFDGFNRPIYPLDPDMDWDMPS
jgi:microcystin degradation protein MlrC